MGLGRVFKRSVRYTFRTKRRFLVFLLIFGIVSTLIAFYIDNLDSLQTDELLEYKGVTVKKVENENILYSQGQSLFQDVKEVAASTEGTTIEDSAIYHYADIDSFIRINSIDIGLPWLSDFANPSKVQSGSFPDAPNEILVPDNSLQSRNITSGIGNIRMDTNLVVGQTITFTNEAEESLSFTISGTFDNSDHDISNVNDQLWVFMDQSRFVETLEFFGMTTDDAFTYMMSFTVEGFVLSSSTYESTETLNNAVRELVEDTATYGNWQDVPDSLPTDEAKTTANRIIVNLSFVVIGGIILSILFAYLITRFRRTEIAILKAMGYSNGAIRTTLIGELLTTSFFGFLVGLSSAQGLLIYLNRGYNRGTLIRWEAIGASFIIMVLISIPGLLLASRRVLGVSPAEAFRDQ